MNDKLKALHLIFNDSPIYSIDDIATSSEIDNGTKNNTLIGFISKYQRKVDIPENELSFLFKIFNAAKIQESDITFSNSLENSSFERVIGMGVNPFELGIKDATFPFYDVKTHDKTTYIFADEITSIMNDKSKKEGLWFGLKKMFGV